MILMDTSWFCVDTQAELTLRLDWFALAPSSWRVVPLVLAYYV